MRGGTVYFLQLLRKGYEVIYTGSTTRQLYTRIQGHAYGDTKYTKPATRIQLINALLVTDGSTLSWEYWFKKSPARRDAFLHPKTDDYWQSAWGVNHLAKMEARADKFRVAPLLFYAEKAIYDINLWLDAYYRRKEARS